MNSLEYKPSHESLLGRRGTLAFVPVCMMAAFLMAGCVHTPPPSSPSPRADVLLLAEDGEARVTLVVAQDASPSTRHAAEELRHFLEEMTGASFPLVTDDTPPGAHEIIVGADRRLRAMNVLVDYEALGNEGYLLRTRGTHLIIAGGEPRGVLYGVYGFLEDHLGCRWFTPDVSVIPEARVLAVSPIDEVRLPVLEYREPFVYEAFDGDWTARNRMNSHAARLEAEHGGKVTYHGFVHTFEALLPPDQYFDEHPEYFSLVNGRRLKERSQLCCTHPDVIRLVTEEVRRRMAAHPGATVFSVSQNDWHNYCECDACTDLAEAEGSQMGPVLALVNHIAREVADDFPDKLVDTLAYQYTRRPPETLRPEPNVIIRLCSIECDFAHPFELRSTPENRAFCNDLESWARVANRLWVWNYNTSYAHYLVPFPNLRVRGPNIRYMIQNNVRGIFEQDVYNTPHGQLSTLSAYLGAKLLWNPEYDTDLAINEFLRGVYCEAATPMRMYLDLLHEAVAPPDTSMDIWIGPDAPFFTDALFERADALFDVATAAVQECPETLERVLIARLSTDYTIMERLRGLSADAFVYDHDRFTVGPASDFKERAERFFAVAERNGLQVIREHDGDLAAYKEEIYNYIQPRRLTPLSAAPVPEALVPGLSYRFYEAHLEQLPDFSALEPEASGVAAQVNLEPAAEQGISAYALLFQGYVHAPRDGVYTFTTRSNDGSRLYVGGREVVDNDGLHKARAVSGFVALKAGWHPFRVAYFEAGGVAELDVFYSGPGIPYQVIPATAFRHAPGME